MRFQMCLWMHYRMHFPFCHSICFDCTFKVAMRSQVAFQCAHKVAFECALNELQSWLWMCFECAFKVAFQCVLNALSKLHFNVLSKLLFNVSRWLFTTKRNFEYASITTVLLNNKTQFFACMSYHSLIQLTAHTPWPWMWSHFHECVLVECVRGNALSQMQQLRRRM